MVSRTKLTGKSTSLVLRLPQTPHHLLIRIYLPPMNEDNLQPRARMFGQVNALPLLNLMKGPSGNKSRIPLHHDTGPRLPLAGPIFAAVREGDDLSIRFVPCTGDGEARLRGGGGCDLRAVTQLLDARCWWRTVRLTTQQGCQELSSWRLNISFDHLPPLSSTTLQEDGVGKVS